MKAAIIKEYTVPIEIADIPQPELLADSVLIDVHAADVVIDYKTQKFEEELSDYDLVLDMMGGEVLEKSFKVLKKGGCLVSIKGEACLSNVK